MTTARGIGVTGALDVGVAAELAQEAERAAYSTFWVNDTPGGDGLASLAAIAEATTRIQLGVGVIPVDRQPAELIARRVHELALPQDRLLIGIGSGGLTAGARDAVRSAAIDLRAALSARIVVGALGPRMCEVAGEAADGVLLNWLTPGYMPVVAAITNTAATDAGRPRPWIGAYVRVALAGPALERLRIEAERYASYPQYAAHFERMGVAAIETCVSGAAAEVQIGLDAFTADADEVVVRAITATETAADYLALLRASAPAGKA